MSQKAYSSSGSKLDVLKIPGKFNRQSFSHGFNVIISSSLIRIAYVHFGLESDLEAKFQYLEILPRSLIPMDQNHNMLSSWVIDLSLCTGFNSLGIVGLWIVVSVFETLRTMVVA